MISLEARFWSHVHKTDTCWLWMGAKIHGYGAFWDPERHQVRTAQQVSWELASKRKVPKGMCILHDCPEGDNPACVRPEHLWLGTKAANSADMVAKGRRRSVGTLTRQQVVKIRQRYAAGALQKDLACEFGVTDSCISLVVNHKTWKEGVSSPAGDLERSRTLPPVSPID